MTSRNHNPFLQTPSIVDMEIQRGRMPSGTIVEIRLTRLTTSDNNQIRKELTREIAPPMADGTDPETVGDIRECHVCLKRFHKDNVRRCPACGRDYCNFIECSGDPVLSKEEVEVAVCARCAEELSRGLLRRMSMQFWDMDGES